MTARREEYADALRNMENGRNGDQDLSQELLLARQRTLFARIEEYYASLYERASEPEPKSLDAELICVKLGETALLSFPGEVFVAIGLAIREKSPVARTMFLGLANDYVGYIPTADANASAGYEVIAARVSPEAASILEQGALELLRSIQVTAAAS